MAEYKKIQIIKKESLVYNGRSQVNYADFYCCWCKIKDLYLNELYSALQTKLNETVIFEVRQCKNISIIKNQFKSFVIMFENQMYEIYSMNPAREKGWIQMKANKVS